MSMPDVLPERGDTSTAGDVDHFYCCDENLAFCGADLTHVPFGSEFGDMCALCLWVDESGCPGCGR